MLSAVTLCAAAFADYANGSAMVQRKRDTIDGAQIHWRC
jgi:hypothetical protein